MPTTRRRAVKRKAAPAPAPPHNADTGDRARTNPVPAAPPQKVRVFAHPNRPKPKAVIRQAVKEQAAAQKHAADVKRVVRRIHVTPVPSPDARDSTRSPAQQAHDRAAVAESVGESRRKYLRRKGSLSITHAAGKALKDVAEGNVQINATTQTSTGAGPTVLRLKRHGGGLGFATITAPVPRTVKISGDNIAGRFAKDVANLPAQVIPSMYVPAAGVVEAVKSKGKDTSRLRKLASDVNKSDPVYNVAAAGVDAAIGNEKGAKKRLAAAGKAASEHPGYTAAEVLATKGAVGRGAGRVMRRIPGRPRKLATTVRAPRTLPGTSLREDRAYSPDVITKAGQVAVEKVQRKRVTRLTRKANEAQAKHGTAEHAAPEAVRLRQKAAEINPDRHISEVEIQKRVDEHVDAQETVRRSHRGDVVNEARDIVKQGKDAGPVLNLLSQGVVRADVGDIKAYIAELKGEYDGLSNAGKRSNKEMRRGLDKAVSRAEKGKVDLEALKPLAEKYREGQAVREKKLADREMLPESQAAKAAAIPYATRRMGAQHTNEHRIAAADAAKESLDLARSRVKGLEHEKVESAGMHRVQRGRDAVKEPQAVYEVNGTRFPTRALAEEHGHLAGGGEVKKISLTAAEAKRVGEVSRIDRALKSAKDDMRRLEGEHAKAREVRNVKELVGKDGKPLSLDEIRQHMEDHGEPIPSWLSQSPNARGAHNFFQSGSRAPGISSEARTGEATRGGTFDAHPDTLTEGAAKQQGLIDAFDGFHAFLDEFGVKGARGKIKTLLTRKQVDEAVRNAMADEHGNPRPGAVKFVAVRVNPFGGRAEQLQKMLEGTDDASMGGAKAINDAIDEALKGGGDGPWALVPEAAAKRLQEHVRVLNPGNAGKVGQKLNSTFRKTVLATSLPWITGNVGEGGMRAALAGAGPRSLVTGRRVLKRARELDKEKGERATARTVGGGHFGSAERQHVHLNVDAMNPGKVRTVSRALSAFWKIGESHPKVPSPASAASLWHGYTHTVFNVVNHAIESQIQAAMLGKALHSSDLMDAPLMRASEAAVDKAARGVLDQNTAASLGRQVDIMYGKYGKWSPDMRKTIALYTPFVAWTLNATYFILRTLPRDHPVALGLIAATENATDEWRKEHGLDKFIEGHVPGWLQGSIPDGKGGHFRAPNRYTPFSLAGDPLGAYAGAVLPMVSGVIAAGKGKDWQGNDLKDDSDYGKAKAAIGAMLGSTVPALALGKAVVAKGVKGATLDAVAGKVAPSKKKVRRSSSSSSKPGTIVAPGAGGAGRIVGPGAGSAGGRIIR